MRKRKIWGLHAPPHRFFLYLLGFTHRLLGTGGYDEETGKITSAWITSKTEAFDHDCVCRREETERALADCWKEVDTLLIELHSLSVGLGAAEPETKQPTTNPARRARDAASAYRAKSISKKHEVIRKLSAYYSEIVNQISATTTDIEAASHALQSTFAAYGHGLVRKPVPVAALPELSYSYDMCSSNILSSHQSSWNKLHKVVKEAQNDLETLEKEKAHSTE